MTTLVYFDVSGHWYNAQDPDTVVSGRITFYPRVPEGLVINLPNLGGNNTAVSFPPVQARIHRGQIEGLAPGHPPLQLLANSTPISTALTNLGIESGNLVYDVQFTQVLFGDAPQTVSNFAFEASTDSTPIDLTDPSLTRLTYLGPAGGGGPLVIGTPGTPGPPGAPGPSWWVGGVPGVLPATSGQHLTTQGGTTLDDGTGNLTVAGALKLNLTGLLKANGGTGVTAVAAPSGAVVGTTDTQALTHKDLTSSTNTFPTTLVPWSGGTAGILPATSGQHLTTQGGNTLDDGSGNVIVKGGLTIPGAAKLVTVADNGWGTSLTTNVTSTAGTGEMMFTVGVAASGITAVWNHWYTNGSPSADTDPAGPISFNASLKIVSSTTPGAVTGTIYRLTFNGRTAATLDPGGRVAADILGVSVSPGDVIAIRTYLASGTAYAPRQTVGVFAGAQGGFTSSGDLTAPGSATIAGSFNYYFGPSGILGYPVSAGSAKSVLLLGDSICAGVGDSGALYTAPTIWPGSFAARALTGNAGIVNAAVAGDEATWFQGTNGSFRRLKNVERCNSAIIEYGTNDLVAGVTAAALQAILLNIATNIRRMGIAKVFVTTIIPRTSSTDSWATTANQTPSTYEAQRVTHNTWVRAGCPVNPTTLAPVTVGTTGALTVGQWTHPFTGFFDTSAQVESSLNSGFWLPASRTSTGSMTSGQNVITSSGANFQSANQESGGDKGQAFVLIGAGAAGANLGATATVIQSVTNTTTAVANQNAGTTVTNATLYIGVSTIDGTHPTSRGHYLMSQAINVSQL